MSGDAFIRLGFWSQLVLLLLVDLGTVTAFLRGGVPWYHYVGFVIINAILLSLTWMMWRWLREAEEAQRR